MDALFAHVCVSCLYIYVSGVCPFVCLVLVHVCVFCEPCLSMCHACACMCMCMCVCRVSVCLCYAYVCVCVFLATDAQLNFRKSKKN